jgi:hypothetical protein
MKPLSRLLPVALALSSVAFAQDASYRLVCPNAQPGAWYVIHFWDKVAQFSTDEPVPAAKLAKHVADECRGVGLKVVGLMDSAVYLDTPTDAMVEFDLDGPALRLERWAGPVPKAGEAADATIAPFGKLLEPYEARELQAVLGVLTAAAGPSAGAAGPTGKTAEAPLGRRERLRAAIEATLAALSESQRAPAMSAVRCLLAAWELAPRGTVLAVPPAAVPAAPAAAEPVVAAPAAAEEVPERSPFGGMSVNFRGEDKGRHSIVMDLQLGLTAEQRKGCQLLTELYYGGQGDQGQELAGRPVPNKSGKLANERGFFSLASDLNQTPAGLVHLVLPWDEIDDGWAGPGVRSYSVTFVLAKDQKELASQQYSLDFRLKCEPKAGKRSCEVLPLDQDEGAKP